MDTMKKPLLGISLAAIMVISAMAGLVISENESHESLLSMSTGQSKYSEAEWHMDAHDYGALNVIQDCSKDSVSKVFTMENCVRTNNGLIFSFINPYAKTPAESTDPELGMKLTTSNSSTYPNKYNGFNYSVTYEGDEQILAFQDKDKPDIPVTPEGQVTPLAWLCGYQPDMDPNSGDGEPKKKETLHIPAIINYNGKDYYVYGVLDGANEWFSHSPFGLNDKGGKTEKGKVIGTSATFDPEELVIHIAFDHYIIPSGCFRENNNLVSVTFDYVSYTIPNTEIYSSGYIAFIGDFAFYKCKNLRTVNLPYRIDNMGYNCFSATKMDVLVFDTSVHAFQTANPKRDPFDSSIIFGGYSFSGNPNLTTLYIGKNVDNLPNNLFTGIDHKYASKFEICEDYSRNIQIVYNAGSSVTEENMLEALTNSDPVKVGGVTVLGHTICQFNLHGGDVDLEAVTSTNPEGHRTITMPRVGIQGDEGKVLIPAWIFENEPNEEYKKKPTDSTVDIFGYDRTVLTFNGTCTATYKIGDRTIALQNLPCDYATETYDVSRLQSVLGGFSLTHWNTQADGSGIDYTPGETIVSVDDITLYAQGAPPITVVYHFKNGSTNYTATMEYSINDVGSVFPSAYKDFNPKPVKDTTGSYNDLGKSTFWCTNPDGVNGDLFQKGGQVKLNPSSNLIDLYACKPSTPTMYTITYSDGIDQTNSFTFWSVDSTPEVEVVPNMFPGINRPLLNWVDDDENTYQPGDMYTFDVGVTTAELTATWKTGSGTIMLHDTATLNTHSQTISLWNDTAIDDVDWTRTGYNLLGWSATQEATNVSFALGMTVCLSENMLDINGELHLYTVWQKVKNSSAVVVLDNAMIVADGTPHSIFNGYTTIGLDSQYKVVIDASDIYRCDTVGSGVADDSTIVVDPGVYTFSATYTTKSAYVNINVPVCGVDIHVTIGTFTVLNSSSYSTVTVNTSENETPSP